MGKIENILTYTLLIFTVYATGSIFFVSYNYRLYMSVLFIFSFVFFFIKNFKLNIRFAGIIKLLFLSIFILIAILINNVTAYSSYIAIFLQIFSSYFIALSIERKEFENKYVNIMSFFAIVSLICYCTMLIYPSIALWFPKTEGYSALDYYNAIIHVFESSNGYASFVPFKRNTSIFWEPGAYQAFLNLAIIILLSNNQKLNKKDFLKLVFFALAVITTYSTTGYIVLFLLLIIYRNRYINYIYNNVSVALIAIGGLIITLLITNQYGIGSYFMSDKLNNEFSDGSFLNRLFLDDIYILFEKPLNFLGISFESYESIGGGSGNSIIHTMVNLGIPFTSILLVMYYNYSTFFDKKLITFIVLLMFFSTESLLWRPIFLCLAWYGETSNDNSFKARFMATKQSTRKI